MLLPVAPKGTGQFLVGVPLRATGPAAPHPSPPLLGPRGQHPGGVEALVVLVGEGLAHHLQDLLNRLAYEGIADGSRVAHQEGGDLLAETLVGDYRPDGGRGGKRYTILVHKHLLMGHVPGGGSRAGTSFVPPELLQLLGLIISDYCKITALIHCIYLNILVFYSVVAVVAIVKEK
jgi:hypothetical protein